MADTTIFIRNPDVVRDIQKLAERTGKPAADAVAYAVRAQLGEAETAAGEKRAGHPPRIAEALAAWDALPHNGEPLTDADLYDEDGMPR